MPVGTADDFDQLDTGVPNVNTQGKEVLDNYQREIRRVWKLAFGKEHYLTGEHKFPLTANPTADVLDPVNGGLAFDPDSGKVHHYDSVWKTARLYQDQAVSFIGGIKAAFTVQNGPNSNTIYTHPFCNNQQALIFTPIAIADLFFLPGTYIFHGAVHLIKILESLDSGAGISSIQGTEVRFNVGGFPLTLTPPTGTPNTEGLYTSNVNQPAGLEQAFTSKGFKEIKLEVRNTIANRYFGILAASLRWTRK